MNREFKHKSTGDIWKENCWNSHYHCGQLYLTKEYVENSEDWEEINIQLDIPILSMKELAGFCTSVWVPNNPGHKYGYTTINMNGLEKYVNEKLKKI